MKYLLNKLGMCTIHRNPNQVTRTLDFMQWGKLTPQALYFNHHENKKL